MRKLLIVALISMGVIKVVNAGNVPTSTQLDNSSLSFGMDQHGSFTVKDLQASPLLKSLFNVSVEALGNHLAKVCIEPQHSCKVVKDNETINVVNSNGVVRFDK